MLLLQFISLCTAGGSAERKHPSRRLPPHPRHEGEAYREAERGITQSESDGPTSCPLEKRRGGFQCLELNALNSWMVGYRPWYRLRQSALPQRRKQTLNSPEGEPKGWTTRE